MTRETRQFEVSKNMIFHTIESQAGSIEKAILECLMNSVDAGATKVDVTLNENGVDYSISDNGRGFQTKDEIIECFGVFGFDHSEDDSRTYGTFGIGRAQLWAFSKNVWQTNQFRLEVDIKNAGLDYTLTENETPHQGCHIEGQFYEQMSFLDQQNVERALKKMALYLPIEFTMNGKKANKDVTKEKWDIETDDAYIKLKDTGNLSVYNLGVFVCEYPNFRFGKGGVVNSKKQLQLNTARNDILQSKCNVWKRLKKYLEDESKKENLKRKVMTDDMRKNLIMQWKSGLVTFKDLQDRKIITDIKGRVWRIEDIQRCSNNITVAASNSHQTAENIHENRVAFVVPEKVLDWFDVETADEMVQTIKTLLSRDMPYHPFINKPPKVIDFKELEKKYQSTYEILTPKKYTRKQKVYANIIPKINLFAHKVVADHCFWTVRTYDLSREFPQRRNVLGVSQTANAWTDGETYIAVNAKKAQKEIEKNGIDGIVNLILLFIHEYLHQDSSDREHVHSHEFFENYHDVTMRLSHNRLLGHALSVMEDFVRECRKKDLSIPPSIAKVDARLINLQQGMNDLMDSSEEVSEDKEKLIEET